MGVPISVRNEHANLGPLWLVGAREENDEEEEVSGGNWRRVDGETGQTAAPAATNVDSVKALRHFGPILGVGWGEWG